MPTTTNFGWTTPADTDLVKDGAGAIRTLGSNIDTSLVDLKGGTSGQYLTKNSNTDLDYAWVTLSAGGMTLLSTTTLSGATTTISSIDQNYKNLLVIVDGVNNNSNFGDYGILPNNSSSCAGNQMTEDLNGFFSSSAIPLTMGTTTGASSTNRNWAINIYNYASSTQQKTFSVNGYNRTKGCWANGTFQSTTAISSLVFTGFGTGSFTAGTVLLYGVK